MAEGVIKPQNDNQASQVKKKPPSLLKDILQLFLKIGGIVLIVILLFTFLFGAFRSGDRSMAPGIKDGDLVLFYRLNKQYVVSDVIVLNHKGEKQVRRVAAVAGDTVDITEDGLMVNGNPQIQEWVYENTEQFVKGIRFPITVGKGEVFVLGDAREHARDSRIYGTVKVEDTLGKVMAIARRRGI